MREAFAYAFDREAYCRKLMLTAPVPPTLSMIPPGVPGHIETDAYAFDPEKARQALAESSYGGPENLPEITWYGEKGNAADRDRRAVVLRAVPPGARRRAEAGLPLDGEELDALYDDPATVAAVPLSRPGSASPDPRGWFAIWRCDSTFNRRRLLQSGARRAARSRRCRARSGATHRALRGSRAHARGRCARRSSSTTIYTTWLVKPYVTGYSRTTRHQWGLAGLDEPA